MDEQTVIRYILATFPDVETTDAFGYTSLLDTLMPHPDYAAQSFICVLSPGDTTAQQVRSLLAEAYERAVQRYQRRHQRLAENGDDNGTVPGE